MSTERIRVDSKVMGGQPVIAGTRITVALILRELERGAAVTDILDQYPHLTAEDVQAAAAYGSRKEGSPT